MALPAEPCRIRKEVIIRITRASDLVAAALSTVIAKPKIAPRRVFPGLDQGPNLDLGQNQGPPQGPDQCQDHDQGRDLGVVQDQGQNLVPVLVLGPALDPDPDPDHRKLYTFFPILSY